MSSIQESRLSNCCTLKNQDSLIIIIVNGKLSGSISDFPLYNILFRTKSYLKKKKMDLYGRCTGFFRLQMA